MLDLTTAFTPFPTLDTERCTLRALSAEDAPELLRLWGDARVLHYLGIPRMTTLDEVRARLSKFSAGFEERKMIVWAVTNRGDGALVGTVRVFNIQPDNFRAEIGYLLLPDWWGKGLMPEAAGAVLDFAFRGMGLHSVEALVDAENTASRRVLEKVGFAQEGYFRENFYDPAAGRFTDTAVYSLLGPAWIEQRGGDTDGRA